MPLKIIQKIIRRSICSGCHSYHPLGDIVQCSVPLRKNRKTCPCSICLVKMMCNTACKILTEYNNFK